MIILSLIVVKSHITTRWSLSISIFYYTIFLGEVIKLVSLINGLNEVEMALISGWVVENLDNLSSTENLQ